MNNVYHYNRGKRWQSDIIVLISEHSVRESVCWSDDNDDNDMEIFPAASQEMIFDWGGWESKLNAIYDDCREPLMWWIIIGLDYIVPFAVCIKWCMAMRMNDEWQCGNSCYWRLQPTLSPTSFDVDWYGEMHVRSKTQTDEMINFNAAIVACNPLW